MENIKYTTDGKKVIVIGDLNQTDKIVQEIFVTKDGDEIPSGERFVERNLLDEPAKSWRETRLEELEMIFENTELMWKDKITSTEREKKRCYEDLKVKVNWLRKVAKQPLESQIKEIINNISIFLSDTEKWVFKGGYDWGISNFDKDIISHYDSEVFFRLLSLYGDSNGEITWKINRWEDGSGSDSEELYFFDDYDKAKSCAQKFITSKDEYSWGDIDKANKLGLVLDKKKVDDRVQKTKIQLLEDIDKEEKKISEIKKSLTDLENKYIN